MHPSNERLLVTLLAIVGLLAASGCRVTARDSAGNELQLESAQSAPVQAAAQTATPDKPPAAPEPAPWTSKLPQDPRIHDVLDCTRAALQALAIGDYSTAALWFSRAGRSSTTLAARPPVRQASAPAGVVPSWQATKDRADAEFAQLDTLVPASDR